MSVWGVIIAVVAVAAIVAFSTWEASEGVKFFREQQRVLDEMEEKMLRDLK